jgi:hypothetical protein
MPVYLTGEGLLKTVARAQKPHGKIEECVITSRREWYAVASAWPLKQLVAIWNGVPGVKPVQRFTSRQIALERIWRVIAGPEPGSPEASGEAGKISNSVSRRLEGSTGLCLARPPSRSDTRRTGATHRLAAA